MRISSTPLHNGCITVQHHRKHSSLRNTCASLVTGPCGGRQPLQGFCDLAPGFPLASPLHAFIFQYHHPPPCPWFYPLPDAMAILTTQLATPRWGDLAHSTTSSPEPGCKGAHPGSDTAELCGLGKAIWLVFTSQFPCAITITEDKSTTFTRVVERLLYKCKWSVQNNVWLMVSTS